MCSEVFFTTHSNDRFLSSEDSTQKSKQLPASSWNRAESVTLVSYESCEMKNREKWLVGGSMLGVYLAYQ